MRPFRDIPIEQKLIVTILVTTSLALLLSGAAILVLDSAFFRKNLRQDLSAQAQIIAENSASAVALQDHAAASQILTTLRARPHVVTACIVGENGAVFASYNRPASSGICPAARAQDDIWFEADHLTVSRTILLTGQPVGKLVLVYDLGEIPERLRVYGALVLAILLVSGLIATLISSQLRKRIVAPVEALALYASHVAATRDYTVRVKKTSADELGVLVDSFNDMLFSIQSRDDDLRKALAEREQALLDARNAREQLELVTDTMASAVSRCSRDRRYIWVSRQYGKWLGMEPGEIAGQTIAAVIGESAYRTLLPYIEGVLAGGRAGYELAVEYRTIGRRWVRGTYVPTRDGEGAVDGWVAEMTDITLLKQAQAHVVQMNEELQRSNLNLARSNDDLERFAYVASHDLQEPLRMVTAYSQLLIRNYGGQLHGEASSFVGNIVEGTRRMRTLLSDLLAYTAINGAGEEPLETVDLNVAVESAVSNLKTAIAESGAVVASEPLPSLRGHRGHFVSLLQNLIGNAIKYRSTEPPRIHISARERDGVFEVRVADNGVGIAPEYHHKIFVPFKRLHGRKIPGTGIGLAICQRVVERYGGRLWVESRVGEGATFTFTLPNTAVAAEARSNGQAAV